MGVQALDRIEQRILDQIDAHREEILTFARDIYTHAELGYKEFRTSEKFAEALQKQNLTSIQRELAVTGVKGYLKDPANTEGPTVALIGEMDALRIPAHRCANPETQGAHCCGHHAQLAGVFGAVFALTDPEVADSLDGNVVFFAVPAEEYGEIEFKNQLLKEGKIRYGGGKCELIRIGAFDDIDLSVAHHIGFEGLEVGNPSSNGFVSKVVRILGRASHAAAAPHKGINALNAAALGHSALQYQRETFRDADTVRVHPIMTKGGDLVNVIPDEAVLEILVRARNLEAITDASAKTDRSYRAGADALGAGYEIQTMPGYLPQIPSPAHPAVLTAAELVAPGKAVPVDTTVHTTASTDLGDLEHIQPVLCFRTGGAVGTIHSPAFDIVDEEEAYIQTAKIFALSAYHLLRNHAEQAIQTVEEYEPVFTRESYVEFMESQIRTQKKEAETLG